MTGLQVVQPQLASSSPRDLGYAVCSTVACGVCCFSLHVLACAFLQFDVVTDEPLQRAATKVNGR